MTKTLAGCFLICCFLSCNITSTNTGQLFVNQKLIESSIREVQPAKEIKLSIQTTNNRDSILIVNLSVDPKIPDDSLNADRVRLILSSFLAILPKQNLESFSSCKVIFLKTEGSVITKSRAIEFDCPVTDDLLNRVSNYKDSSRASIGFIDPNWTYFNKELNVSLPLKAGWFYASDEHDSLVYYAIGSDINQLPQYRTDPDRKVTFLTLRGLSPGVPYSVLELSKKNEPSEEIDKAKADYWGPRISAGLILNRFESEDEYLKKLYELVSSKKLPKDEIHSYIFGNARFRGLYFERPNENGKMIHYISALRQFTKVSLVVNLQYSNTKELEEIKNNLSDLNIN
jgi:hypothetical protein